MGKHDGASVRHVGMYNALIIAFACFGSITYGYCAAIIGTTLGQPSFLSYFGLDTASNAPQLEGAMNGLFQGGGLLGCLFGGWAADRFGRRWSMLGVTAISIIGGALQAGSVAIAMFLVARFITGFGIGGVVLLVPLWQSEIAPPKARGLLVGLHGVFILVGYNLATWLGVAFFYVNVSGAQWRPPLAIQVVPALILACGLPFVPESPRWLIEHGQREVALQILQRLHPGSGADNHSFAEHEFRQITTQLDYERTLESSWKSIFTVAHYRKRAIVGFTLLLAGQLTGTLVINNYGPSLYAALGYGPADTLIITGGWILLGLFANIANALLIDRTGRKWLMVTGMLGCCVALLGEIIMLALYENSDNRGGKIAAVFFLFLHLAFYGSGVDGSTYVYASEIWPTHLRAKGFSFSIAGLFVGSLILLVSAPTAFDNIGWKFYLVMLVATLCSAAIIALYFPETKGLPLEEIAARFGDSVTMKLEGESIDGSSPVESVGDSNEKGIAKI